MKPQYRIKYFEGAWEVRLREPPMYRLSSYRVLYSAWTWEEAIEWLSCHIKAEDVA